MAKIIPGQGCPNRALARMRPAAATPDTTPKPSKKKAKKKAKKQVEVLDEVVEIEVSEDE